MIIGELIAVSAGIGIVISFLVTISTNKLKCSNCGSTNLADKTKQVTRLLRKGKIAGRYIECRDCGSGQNYTGNS